MTPQEGWSETTDSPEILAARTIAILVCRHWNEKIYAQRGCEELDLRYGRLRRALAWSRLDADAAPATLYPLLLERLKSQTLIFKAVRNAIGTDFSSDFGKLATYVLVHWNELPGKQRDMALIATAWIPAAVQDWPPEIVSAVENELVHTAVLLHLFTNIWFLRRCGRILVPDRLAATTDFPGVNFSAVLDEEMEEIAKRRGEDPHTEDAGTPASRTDQANLAGLAFSGGGIRSATFNLGVLQYLGSEGLLHTFDYLSTVSGGGFIGSWLHAWIHQADSETPAHPQGMKKIEDCLKASMRGNPQDAAADPVHFLRQYSNYLTPQTGFWSADTWTMANIWLRNILLNLVVLVLALSAALLTPRWVAWSLSWAGREGLLIYWWVLLIVPAILMGVNTRMESPKSGNPGIADYIQTRFGNERAILLFGVIPTFLAAACGGMLAVHGPRSPLEFGPNQWDRIWAAMEFGIVVFLMGLFICITSGLFRQIARSHAFGRLRWLRSLRICASGIWVVLACGSAGFVATILFLLLLKIEMKPDPKVPDTLQYLTWSAPVFITLLSLSIYATVGMLGRFLPDYRREWIARLSAWLGVCAAGWLVICALATYSHAVLELLSSAAKREVGGLAWLVTTAGGVLSSRKIVQNQEQTAPPSKLASLVAALAPPLFTCGLLVLLASALHVLVGEHDPKTAFEATLGCGALALFISSCVDINEFSLHQFYRNRLVRCYLGGARSSVRTPNMFTGFDPHDDFRLAALAHSAGYTGPYPIYNSTLNVVHGDELAWQERKGEAFAFTPRYCGFDVNRSTATHPRTVGSKYLTYGGYRPTGDYAYPNPADKTPQKINSGIQIGNAMAISGAAASPNMGSMTKTSLAFLMTIFDMRLGWWLGNPRREDTWRNAGPTTGLFYLLSELTANTNDTRKYVYVSDAAHFENFGVYELVRRRCRYIVVCDSEQDGDYAFCGLGNALRKCRTDFGVKIHIDIEPIKPKPGTHSAAHCAIGTIDYPPCSGSAAAKGILLYLKSSLTGDDEPADLFQYALLNRAFPHDSTADQWFDETRFESYRTLGVHVARKSFETLIGYLAEHPNRPAEPTAFEQAIWPQPAQAATASAAAKSA